MDMIKCFRFNLLLASLILLQSCATVPVTGRKQIIFVSDSFVTEGSSLTYQEFLNDRSTTVIENTIQARFVRDVGIRMADAVSKLLEEKGHHKNYNFDWEFKLVDNPQLNAWCMPGGKIVVNSGILTVAKTEAGLAAVMGHEIAHAIARHGAEKMSKNLFFAASVLAVHEAVPQKNDKYRTAITATYGLGGIVALQSYSRSREYEADRLGLIFMALAGYDPNEAIVFWGQMAEEKAGTNKLPGFLQTHPSDAKRMMNIQKLIPEAMTYYNKFNTN